MNTRRLHLNSVDTCYCLISPSGNRHQFGYYIRGNTFYAVNNIIVYDDDTLHKWVCDDLLKRKNIVSHEVREALRLSERSLIIMYLITKFIAL